MSNFGHNGGPPLAVRNFKKRWAEALFARRDKPMGSVAMGFLLYLRMDGGGRGIVVSDAEFQLYCGVSDGSCRIFKKWLLKARFIEVVRRGYRGSVSEFQALIPDGIPAVAAAIQDEIPAANTGIPPYEYRQPIPVLGSEMPAAVAGIPELAATSAGISARGLVINYNNKNNYLPTTTTVEQEAARGGFGSEFEALNGSAVDLATFIARAANVDFDVAKNMLRTNVKTYGSEAMLDAYSTTMAEMAEGVVASPYKYLLGCAKKNKERGTRSAKPEASGETKTERWARKLRELEAAEQGGRKP